MSFFRRHISDLIFVKTLCAQCRFLSLRNHEGHLSGVADPKSCRLLAPSIDKRRRRFLTAGGHLRYASLIGSNEAFLLTLNIVLSQLSTEQLFAFDLFSASVNARIGANLLAVLSHRPS